MVFICAQARTTVRTPETATFEGEKSRKVSLALNLDDRYNCQLKEVEKRTTLATANCHSEMVANGKALA